MEIRKISNTLETKKWEDTLWGEGLCTVCGDEDIIDLFNLSHVPTQEGALGSTYEEALHSPMGDITLSLCQNCGYIGNRLFNPDKIKFTEYNISLEHSPIYQSFIMSLASRLIKQYKIHEKTVLEIGCGNGYFLKTICALGGNKGIGIDPSYAGGSRSDVNEEILFIKDYYSEKYAYYHGDLVCCRQVLDHLGNPKKFLQMVRRAIGNQLDTVLYFEVVNSESFFTHIPWNVGVEHSSWFFPKSLRILFELCGFIVREVIPCNNNDYLGIEVVPKLNYEVDGRVVPLANQSHISEDIRTFNRRFQQAVNIWTDRIQNIEKKGIRSILWGAGGRAIGFLNILKINQLMPYVVDINPGRIGKFLPGTGQKVVPPEFLIDYKPELIIITNPTYQSEIQEQCLNLGLSCNFLVL